MAIYGLLVGVNQYKSSMINTLRGCENDTYLFSQTLQARFKVRPENLQILLNAEATHQKIIDHFQQHLIEREWGQDDVAVFYFSGHGAQTAAPEIFWDIEPDHLNESLVCHDSRTPGIPDLLDKELRYLIAQLAAAKCGHIAVFLDSCHGGHGTRFIGETPEEVRLAPVDMTAYPLDCFVFGQQGGKTLDQAQLEKLIPDSGKHILLSGCQSFQLSREKPQGPGPGLQHGLFTYALCETLSALPYPVSYRELRNRIHIKVQSQNASQSPQLEAISGADANQSVLGGDIQPLHLQVFQQDDEWKLRAGAIHGFRQGDEIALFADAVSEDISQAPTATLKQVGAYESTLAIAPDAVLDAEHIYNGVVVRRHFAKTGVHLVGEEDALAAARTLLDTDTGAADPGHFLAVNDNNPRYELHLEAGVYHVTQCGDERPLFEKTPDVRKALEQLAIMARWWQKLELVNPDTTLPDDAIDIVLTYKGKEHVSEDVTLRYELQDNPQERWLQPEVHLELRLKKDFPKPLYCALLYFDGSTGAIDGSTLVTTTLMTNQQGNGAGQAEPVTAIKIYEGQPIPLQLKDELYQQGITRIQDHLQLIVSEEEFDASILEQTGNQLYSGSKAVRGGLGSTLQQLMDDVHNRSLALPSRARKAVDWYARTITLTIIRPLDAQQLQPDRAITLATDDRLEVRMEPHASFRGTVRLINASDENSKLAATQQRPAQPMVLADPASAFSFSRGLNADLGLDALEVFIDSGSRSGEDAPGRVSADNPLILSLNHPLAEGEQILPYTHDGEFFLPLGYASSGTDGRTLIHILDLPESAVTTPEDTRSLGSALKIYFRKLVYHDLLRLDEEIHSLRVFDAKAADYDTQAVTADKVAGAGRILLLIHGIIGQTSAMAGCLNLLHSEGQTPLASQYDLVLTFDYENLNTRIQDIAKALKAQLEKAGITPDSGKHIDILAHSMGGLVSRWFIEREGGDAIVNKLVMVGTPNGGSPIATVKEQGYSIIRTWAYSNLVAILNGLTTAYVGGAVVAALMKLLDAVDNTLDQMAPDSDFIHELANSAAPQNTRYAVIAGDTSGFMIQPGQGTARLARLLEYLGKRLKLAAYDLLTEKLFKEANDMAVGNGSMAQFNPAWPDVGAEHVQCDHLSYFMDKTTVQRIAQQLNL
jgi:pimeloyl-ACP methyl ester carboxylesterase